MEEFGVLSERIHDNFRDLSVEVDSGNDLQLFYDFFEITIGKENELLRTCLTFLDVGDRAILLIFLVTLAKQTDKLLSAVLCLNLLDNLIDLLDEVLEDGLESVHATVLAQISEMRDVISDLDCLVIGNTDVDQVLLQE